jgi:hypothetical protein
MSAMLTYFGFIVTQTHALTKGSYRLDGVRTAGIEPTRQARSDGSGLNISGLEARSKSGKRRHLAANRGK